VIHNASGRTTEQSGLTRREYHALEFRRQVRSPEPLEDVPCLGRPTWSSRRRPGHDLGRNFTRRAPPSQHLRPNTVIQSPKRESAVVCHADLTALQTLPELPETRMLRFQMKHPHLHPHGQQVEPPVPADPGRHPHPHRRQQEHHPQPRHPPAEPPGVVLRLTTGCVTALRAGVAVRRGQIESTPTARPHPPRPAPHAKPTPKQPFGRQHSANRREQDRRPVYLRVRLHGPPRQGRRPDLRRHPRRHARRGPLLPRRLRNPRGCTGLVVVAGEVTTSTYVDIPDVVREHHPRDRLHLGRHAVRRREPAPCWSPSTSSPGHRHGRRQARARAIRA
jgi:hypothetical protein